MFLSSLERVETPFGAVVVRDVGIKAGMLMGEESLYHPYTPTPSKCVIKRKIKSFVTILLR